MKFKVCKDAEPSQEVFGVIMAVYLFAGMTTLAIMDYIEYKETGRSFFLELFGQIAASLKARWQRLFKTAQGKFVDGVVYLLQESQGGYPLKDCFINLDSSHDGACFAVKGKNPVTSEKIVKWTDLQSKIKVTVELFTTLCNIKPSGDCKNIANSIQKNFIGSKIPGVVQNMKFVPALLQTSVAQFNSDRWFNVDSNYSDFQNLANYALTLVENKANYVISKNRLVEHAKKNKENRSVLEGVAATLWLFDACDECMKQVHAEIHSSLSILKKMWKDKDIRWGVDEGDALIPFDCDDNYLRPSNYVDLDDDFWDLV